MSLDFAIARPPQYRAHPLFSGIYDPFAGYGRQVTGNCCQVLGDRYPLFAVGYDVGRKSPDSWNGRGPTLADQAVCRPGLGYAPQPGPKPSSACANAMRIIAESAAGHTPASKVGGDFRVVLSQKFRDAQKCAQSIYTDCAA